MQDSDFSTIVNLICKEDSRFDKRAYSFVRQLLDYTVKEVRRKHPDRVKRSPHLTGPELLEGMRTYALEQFGPMAKTVLNAWGVTTCADIGEIVFNLIEYNVFSKTENDRREDFSGIYDFDEAFEKPFLPKLRNSSRASAGSLDHA